VAEGVEDQGAQDRLADLGCDLFQGYHLARPMREADFAAWLAGRPLQLPRLRSVPQPRDAEPVTQRLLAAP
jgi:predicted signal transduction protein with EAL and GGDEF domain